MNKFHLRKKNLTREDMVFSVFTHCFLIICSAFFLFPLLNVVAQSFSDNYHIIRGDVILLPKGFNLDAYAKLFSTDVVMSAYLNTILIAVGGCVLGLIMTAVAAYPLVFAEFKMKKIYSAGIMFTMWFSGGLIPTYIVMQRYGLLDSAFSLIFNSLIGAYNVLIMKSYFTTIPSSLIESARIDGASDPFILFRIVIPLAKASLATIALWIIVGYWNDYLTPLTFLKSQEKYTLQLVLRELLNASRMDAETAGGLGQERLSEQLRYAVVVFSMLPIVAVYPFFQKYFVKGVMIGAVKG